MRIMRMDNILLRNIVPVRKILSLLIGSALLSVFVIFYYAMVAKLAVKYPVEIRAYGRNVSSDEHRPVHVNTVSTPTTTLVQDLIRYANVTPVILRPGSLKNIQRMSPEFDLDVVGVVYYEISRLRKIHSYMEFVTVQLSVTRGQLPPDVYTQIGKSQEWELCYFFRSEQTNVTFIALYETRHFVYIPTCDRSYRDQSLASAILGKTPLIFDRFEYEFLNLAGSRVAVPNNRPAYLLQFPSSTYRGCRRDIAWNYTDLNETPKEAMKTIMSTVYLKENLLILGKLPMIFSGSLLAWYRQCYIMKDASDVDLAMFRKDLDKPLHTYLRLDPNIKGVHFNIPKDGFQYQIFVYEQKMDVYFLFDTNKTDEVYIGEWAPEREALRAYYPRSKVCSTILLGHRFNVPCKVEPLLEAEYGKDWKTPVKEWNWVDSPHNIRNVGPWSDKVWPYANMDLRDSENITTWF